MTQEEVNPETTIITGNLLIANILANTLIDTCATHLVVSTCFIQRLGFKPDESMNAFRIMLPSGSSLLTNKIVRACKAEILNHKMLLDLVVLDDGI